MTVPPRTAEKEKSCEDLPKTSLVNAGNTSD